MAKPKKEVGTILPVTDATVFNVKENGEVPKLKYLAGSPLGYRFDAGKGIFNIKGTKNVTDKPGKELKIIPIGYRIFKDSLFNYSRREWLELFFVNGKGAVCVLMFHGYSVQHFKETLEDLFYEDCDMTQCVLTITPQKKQSKSADGKTYYIAEFEAEELEAETVDIFQTVTKGLELYRGETVTSTNEMINSINYPVAMVEAEKVNGEEPKKLEEGEKATEEQGA